MCLKQYICQAFLFFEKQQHFGQIETDKPRKKFCLLLYRYSHYKVQNKSRAKHNIELLKSALKVLIENLSSISSSFNIIWWYPIYTLSVHFNQDRLRAGGSGNGESNGSSPGRNQQGRNSPSPDYHALGKSVQYQLISNLYRYIIHCPYQTKCLVFLT